MCFSVPGRVDVLVDKPTLLYGILYRKLQKCGTLLYEFYSKAEDTTLYNLTKSIFDAVELSWSPPGT